MGSDDKGAPLLRLPLLFACLSGSHPCAQQCTPVAGRVQCSCFQGYVLNGDGHTCEGETTSQQSWTMLQYIYALLLITQCTFYSRGAELSEQNYEHSQFSRFQSLTESGWWFQPREKILGRQTRVTNSPLGLYFLQLRGADKTFDSSIADRELNMNGLCLHLSRKFLIKSTPFN